MDRLDTLLIGGTIVTPRGRRRTNIGISDGRIAFLGGTDVPASSRVIDVGGLHVLPGAVDTHVHLMDPGETEREDFPSGTAAAAASGVTTIVEHTHSHPVRTAEDLRAKKDYLRGRSHVDFGLAAHAWPGLPTNVPELWQAGIAFFKVFTCTTHGVPGHNAHALWTHLQESAAVDAVSLIHCEDESLTEGAEKVLRAAARTDGGLLPEWRNREAELVAAVGAGLLVRHSGARATVAHVSNPEVASYLRTERQQGARIAAECCPQYFALREPEAATEGTLRKFTPPARARSDADEHEMWRLLRNRTLSHISSDHAPSTRKQKSAGDIWSAPFGLPGLDTTMSILLDAAGRGLLSLEDIADTYAEQPARTYGLWPRKGGIHLGADADLAVVDTSSQHTLRSSDMHSKAGWTPYDGRVVHGHVATTLLRGQLIAEDRNVDDARTGQFIAGAGARS